VHTECNSAGALPQELTDEIRVLVKGKKALGLMVQSYSCEPYQHYLKVFGERQAVKIDWRNLTCIRQKKSGLPDSINRIFFNNLSEAFQLTWSTVLNVFNFATKRTVPYHGMKSLIELFYKSIEEDREASVPYNLVKDTEKLCDRIYKDIPKKHLHFDRRLSNQQNIRFKGTVLITGASGLVGVATVKRLMQEGYRVRAFVRKLSYIRDLELLGAEICFGDIRYYESFQEAAKDVDTIIHLAAAMGVPSTEYESITVGGVKNLIRITQELNISKVIYMSSMSVYDIANCKKGKILNEEHAFESRPTERGAYAHSKLEAEKLILTEIKNSKVKWTVLRPSMILGKSTNIFLKPIGFKFGTKIRIVFGLGNDKLRLIHVDDVAEAILLVMKNKNSNGMVYNINYEERISKRQYLKNVIKPVQGKGLNIYVPHFLMLFIIYIQEIIFKLLNRKPFLTRYRYISSQKDVIINSSKIRNELDWKPKRTLSETFKLMFGI
jgi:nucleoside-diphosphate-sugar epimerase